MTGVGSDSAIDRECGRVQTAGGDRTREAIGRLSRAGDDTFDVGGDFGRFVRYTDAIGEWTDGVDF